MTSLLIFILTFLSLILKKSKVVACFVFGLMWVLFGWNYWNGDYDMYEAMYENQYELLIDVFKYEGGYDVLMLISNLWGFNFQEFLIIISAFILLSLFRFLLVFSKFPPIVALFFMFALFPLQYVLLRNFLAFAIVLHGMISLLKDAKYKYIKYVLAVLIACTIHISSFFYLLFLPAFFKKKIAPKNIYILVALTLILFILSLNLISAIIDLSPKERNLVYDTGFFQFLLYSLIQIANLYFISHFLHKKDDPNSSDFDIMNKNILYVNILMLFLIVLYFKTGIFIRILINVSFINMVFITNQFRYQKYNTDWNKILIFLYLIFNFFMFVFVVRENSLIPMFEKNLLLD